MGRRGASVRISGKAVIGETLGKPLLDRAIKEGTRDMDRIPTGPEPTSSEYVTRRREERAYRRIERVGTLNAGYRAGVSRR